MSDVVVGLIALGAGIVLCFLGRVAARLILSIWGAFVGLTLGAVVTSALTGTSPFSTAVSWLVSILLALLLGALAYAFYALAVAVTIGSIGYGLGATVSLAVGGGETVVQVVALTVGVGLGLLTLFTNLPEALLIVLTATSGAAAIVAGLMLMLGTAEVGDFAMGRLDEVILENAWWTVLYAAVVLGGIIVQSRSPHSAALQSR